MNDAKKLCIYHGNCADGFGAAWVVRKALGPDVEFHAAHYGGTPPDVDGKHVVIVDFSYPYDTLIELADQAASVLILDHHKTAQEDLKGVFSAGENYEQFNGECKAECLSCNAPHIGQRFDMTRSGAGLAWDFFFPGRPRPALINHIEDRDLWLFKLEGTREIQANLFSYPYDFEVWDQLMAADVLSLVSDGAAIERKHHKDIAELVGVTKRRLVIGGHDVPVASLPYTLTSDAGHLMAQGEPFAACYWDTPTGRVFSLRSTDGGMDVSEIASQYGGGGHRNAAGFRVPFDHSLASPAADYQHIANSLTPKVTEMTTTTNNIPTAFGIPFAGGFYAGRFQIDGTEFALIASPEAQGENPEAPWGKYGQDVAGARSCNDGLANTRAMASAGNEIAQWALDLVINDHHDWYLPSRDELELCYRNLKPTAQENWASLRDGDNPSSLPTGYPYSEQSPGQTTSPEFQEGGAEAFSDSWYLSSTQYSPNLAWIQHFVDGNQHLDRKDYARRARAVRRFKVTP